MTLEQLKYFIDVAETRNMTVSAQKFFITPQGLSRSLKGLQQELNTLLFTYNKGKIELTPEGQLYYTQIKDHISQISIINERIRKDKHIKISVVIASYIYGMVAEILENYQKDHPEHRLLICEVPDKAAEQRLLEQKTDLALITGPIFSNDLNYRILIESPDYLCLPEDHPLAQKTSIHFRDIQNEPFVTMNADFKIYDCYVNHMLELSCSPKIIFNAASLEAAEEVLKRKKAIAMHNVQYHLSPEGFVKIPMKEKAQ